MNNFFKKVLPVLILGMIIGFVVYNGMPKVAENQKIDKDGVQIHIISDGKISQKKVDEFLESYENQPSYLKNKVKNVYLMTQENIIKSENEIYWDGAGNVTHNGFAYDYDVYISSSSVNIDETLTHEMWHVYDFVYGDGLHSLSELDSNLINLYNQNKNMLGKHAAENYLEFFATAGETYTNDQEYLKEVDINMYNYFESLPKE